MPDRNVLETVSHRAFTRATVHQGRCLKCDESPLSFQTEDELAEYIATGMCGACQQENE